jgi:hypothetical protein
MANRGIVSATLLAAIEENVVTYYDCLSISTEQSGSDVVYRVTNAPQDVVVDGQTYVAFGQYLVAGDIEEDTNMDIPLMSVQLSGIAPYEPNAPVTGESFMQTMLKDTTNYIDYPITRHRVYFDLNFIDKGAVLLFEGRISNASITFDPEGVSSVALEATSHWVDFTRTSGRFTNTNSQQSHYAGDLGFQYAKDIMKDIIWQEPPE